MTLDDLDHALQVFIYSTRVLRNPQRKFE